LPPEEELPCDDLLQLLKAQRQRENANLPLDWGNASDLLQLLRAHQQRESENLPQDGLNASSEDMWQRLVCRLPEAHNGTTTEPVSITAKEAKATAVATGGEGHERHREPVEVQITSQFHETPLHGLVVNRSKGGLAILCDVELAPGLIIYVRAIGAPPAVPGAELQVRDNRPAGQHWLMGCQYRKETPWSVKVWFG
jgi:hypothetical protein